MQLIYRKKASLETDSWCIWCNNQRNIKFPQQHIC